MPNSNMAKLCIIKPKAKKHIYILHFHYKTCIVFQDLLSYIFSRPYIKDIVIPTSHIHVPACSSLTVRNYDVGL